MQHACRPPCRFHLPRAALLWLSIVVFGGCESTDWARTLNESFSKNAVEERKLEEQHRSAYIASRSRESLRWLLSHKIDSGMSLATVCQTLGEQGEREENDNWLKTKGGNYQLGDEAYAFGPDSEGTTVYLVFRDGVLVNFDPREFR